MSWFRIFLVQSLLILSGASNDFCFSQQCLKTAASFLSSMDHGIDPCDNFYKHVCGRWSENKVRYDDNPKYGWFIERKRALQRAIFDFLNKEDSDDDPIDVQWVRYVYNVCVDIESNAESGVDALKSVLEDIGLSLMPPVNPSRQKPNLMKIIARTYKKLALSVFLGFNIIRNPLNNTELKLEVDTPGDHESASLSKISLGDDDDYDDEEEEETPKQKINIWSLHVKNFMKFFIDLAGKKYGINKNINKAVEDLRKIFIGNKEIKHNEEVLLGKVSELPEEMTVKELQDLVDSATRNKKSKIQWAEYLNELYLDVENVTLDLNSDSILVNNKPYYIELSKLFARFNERQLTLFIWFQIVYTMAHHVSAEVSEAKIALLRGLHATPSTNRQQWCASQIDNTFYPALNYLLLDHNIKERSQKAINMMNNLIQAFISRVEKAGWLDQTTKEKAVEKAREMKIVAGFHKSMWEKDFYENIFDVDFNETNFYNFQKTYESDTMSTLSRLRDVVNDTGGGSKGTDINLYYSREKNLVFVPAAMLSFPFYDLGLESLSYGAIGTLIGHEVTHGFDDIGRFYDKYGNYKDWWTEESSKEYEKRAKCFVEKFDSYIIPELNRSVSGELTLNENIADSGGLLEAFLAYKKIANELKEEKLLPGFQNYTNDQLFFLSYAHMWCSFYLNANYMERELTDMHSPDSVRALLTLQNSDIFQEVWQCPTDSLMYSKKKCYLW